ncbi:MAG: ELM1/GtrOC1 family putative glycosyltransferase [Candidatus Omnitrophica bacterium]|nr:ELM1/GtrOC1 family putative glycosyltransferase [Candidatus Omnitrophota bacterium]
MYKILKFIKFCLNKLPLFVLYVFGQGIGWFIYLHPKKRRTAFVNVKLAFPEKTSAQVQNIVRRSFRNLGLSIIETFLSPKFVKYVNIDSLKDLDLTNAVLVGVHGGSWELYNFALSSKANFAVLAKRQKNKVLDKFLNEIRANQSLEVCFTLKELLRYMKKGYVVGMVVDHGAEDNAIYVELFSHLVPTPRGAVYVARKLERTIYPCYGVREHGFSHKIITGDPIVCNNKTDMEILNELHLFYERVITQYPAEYLWSHKRFKRKKDKIIAILSDNKKGHEKQSLAFVSYIFEYLKDVKYKVIHVRYKFPFMRMLAEALAFIFGENSIFSDKCLSLLLKKDSALELRTTFADIVVSTGSFVAPVTKLFSTSIRSKSVSILRPNILTRKFDAVIVPEHDRVTGDNIVVIKGALTYPRDLEDKAQKCRDKFNLKEHKRFSVFIGGPLFDKETYIRNVSRFMDKVKHFALDSGYRVLISTSRRTPPEIDELISEKMEYAEGVEVIIYANRENHDFVFDGFIALSDFVLVSAESISMISEIIALEKPCAAVRFERMDGKHKIFLNSIENTIEIIDNPYNLHKIRMVDSGIMEYNRTELAKLLKRLG